LNQEGKRWATKVARESHTIRENNRRLASYQALREAGHRSDPNDQNGPDLETKIEALIDETRKAEVIKMKCEARLECLKQGGISVEEWIQEAETLSVQEMPRSGSSLSLRTDASKDADKSSDSFYDSDNAADVAAEAIQAKSSTAPKTADEIRKEYRESLHDSSEFEDDDEIEERQMQQIQQQVETFTANWEGNLTHL
jgi:F-BAR and double SH3 domains protein